MKLPFATILMLFIIPLQTPAQTVGDAARPFFHQDNVYSPPDTATLADADADRFFDSAGIIDQTQKNAVYRLVMDLKGIPNNSYYTVNIWDKIKALYPVVGGTANAHKWNLKKLQDADTSFRLSFNGTIVHDQNGMHSTNKTGWVETYISRDSLLAWGSFSFGIYANTFDNSSNQGICGGFVTLAGSVQWISVSSGINQIGRTIASLGGGSGASVGGTGNGFFFNTIGGFDGVHSFPTLPIHNGTIYFNRGTTPGYAPSFGTFRLLRDVFNNFSNDSIAFFFAGLNLTKNEALALNNAVMNFEMNLNR